jgi:UTP-glucose-1-phosphate uridylyltransferase
VPISFAYQTTPQGTAHALLCAEPLIRGPFAVANADDFYGADAWERAGAWLAGPLEPIDAAVVTYRLDATLSPYGGVSRAVCRTGAEGRVEGITELLDVRRVDGRIVGREEGRAEREVPPDSPTSMNLWVLQAAIFAPLQDRFRQFLAAERGDTDEEFRLSTEMNALLRAGRVRIRSLRTSAPWMGVTYAADGPFVRKRIAALVQAGVYPASLRADSKERTG